MLEGRKENLPTFHHSTFQTGFRCRAKTSSWSALSVKAGTISRPRTGGSTPNGRSGRSTARGAISSRRTRNRSNGDGRSSRAAVPSCVGRTRRPLVPVLARRAQRAAQGDVADVDELKKATTVIVIFVTILGIAIGLMTRSSSDVREAGGEAAVVPDLRWYAIQTTRGTRTRCAR